MHFCFSILVNLIAYNNEGNFWPQSSNEFHPFQTFVHNIFQVKDRQAIVVLLQFYQKVGNISVDSCDQANLPADVFT